MLLTTQTHYFTTEPSHLVVAFLSLLAFAIAFYFDYRNNSESSKKEEKLLQDLQNKKVY